CILRENLWSELHAANQVSSRALVVANVFEQHAVGHQRLVRSQGEGLCKGLRIIDSHFVFQVSNIAAPEAFGDPQRLCLWMPTYVEPPQVVEACGVDHERILFPMSDGVTQPSGIQLAHVFWKLPPIRVDGSMRTVRRLMED